jgi:hypothetical protein
MGDARWSGRWRPRGCSHQLTGGPSSVLASALEIAMDLDASIWECVLIIAGLDLVEYDPRVLGPRGRATGAGVCSLTISTPLRTLHLSTHRLFILLGARIKHILLVRSWLSASTPV